MKAGLPRYKAGLSSAQVAEGMNAATRNSLRLFEDARVMLQQERYSSAVALAILSIEEAGKHHVLRELALARNQEDLFDAWRDYRQHTSKNQMWLLIDSVLKGGSKLGDFAPLFDPASEHPQILDQLKQVSLYTDCLGNGHWSVPDEVIDANLAKMLVGVAEVLCHCAEVTTEEIDLWILHLQPVWKTTTEAMQGALVAWDREMHARGLKSASLSMEDFINRGIGVRWKDRDTIDESNTK
jgi:AbiV family abortive infection protein